MPATPSLPPYAHLDQEAVQCIASASVRYEVPELLLHAVLMKEGGRMGQQVRNRNGTYDMGLAQINTSWLEHFARYGVRREHLLNDTCTNLAASAYILKRNYNLKQRDWFKAVVAYNIGPNNWTETRYRIGYRYAVDVVRWWWGFQNWVDANTPKKGAQFSTATPAHTALTQAFGRTTERSAAQVISTPPASDAADSSPASPARAGHDGP